MNLTYSQIKECTLGAEFALETELGLTLYRFNEEELEMYTERCAPKLYSSSGIRIAFTTDASALTLGLVAEKASSRTFFAVELFEDGERSGVLRNFEDGRTFDDLRDNCTYGAFEQTFPLKEGTKAVELYLPWSASSTITRLELTDATFAEPIKRESVLLMYGDSITQGYDAYLPSQSYSNRLADALGMQVVNKAIGGEVFYPPLAEAEPTVEADLITVAYGTNDFSKSDWEVFKADSRAFFEALAERHPETPILAITPIWRLDWESERKIPSFHAVEEHLRAIAEEIPNMSIVPGFNLVPQDTDLFSDRRLHPNDEGFAYYGDNLARLILPLLEEQE